MQHYVAGDAFAVQLSVLALQPHSAEKAMPVGAAP